MKEKHQIRKAVMEITGLILIFIFIFGSSASALSERTFTVAELARYNGRNGNPAYVAVNGVVYDVTKLPSWVGGRHFCPNAFAGRDISALWNLVPPSHRNSSFLKQFPVAGKLAATHPQPPAQQTTGQVFTIQDLGKYNGKNGARSYVAVNEVVYDLTNVPEWSGGKHFCAQAVAGKDISFLWNLVPPSHRNPNFLKRFKVVGTLTAVKTQPSTAPSTPQAEPASLWRNLLAGLGIAVAITLLWLVVRFGRKKA